MKSFLVAGDRFVDHASRNLALLPPDDLDSPSFQILVDMKEVLHLLQIMLRKIGDVDILVVIRVMTRHCEDFVVGLAAIEHLENSQRPAIDLAARKCRDRKSVV